MNEQTRYFINGKEVTAKRYAAMERLNAYISRKSAEAFSRGDIDNVNTRAAWFTLEAAGADSIARYMESCRNFGYLKEKAAKTTGTTAASLKGMAKHVYNRIISALAADASEYCAGAFAALTDGAKAIAYISGHFANLYIRGERKSLPVEDAAKELTERAAATAERKLRKADHVIAVAFLAEYLRRRRQRQRVEVAAAYTSPQTTTQKEIQPAELTHAGQCLEIYLDNTREIYERYTVPAIEFVAAFADPEGYMSQSDADALSEQIAEAIKAAARLVKKYDHLTPTAEDVEQVTRTYRAYIADCAK